MKKKALNKDFYMEIKNTLNRFLSIFLIAALGVAFFAGIRACEPDMEISADRFYDENRYMDIRVLSTLGLTDEDVSALQKVEGVELVEPSYSMDVLSYREEGMYTLKVFSMLPSLNQVTPTEGRLPEKSGECILDSGLKEFGYQVGDVILIQSGTEEDIEDSFATTEYTVVGMGITPAYISLERESSQIGRGYVDGFMAVCEEDFAMDVYTEIYLSVAGAKDLVSYQEDYEDLVESVVDNVELIQTEREEARYAEIKSEADEKIKDAEMELADGKKEAEEELTDAYNKLTDAKEEIAEAKQEIADGKKEIADGKKEVADAKKDVANGKKELADGKKEIADGKKELEDGEKELADGKKELEDGEKEIADGKKELEDGERELEENRVKLLDAEKELKQGKKDLKKGRKEYEDGIARIASGREELEAKKPELLTARAEIDAQKEELEKQFAEYEQAKQMGYSDPVVEQQLSAGKEQLAAYETQIAEGEAQIAASEAELLAGEEELAKALVTLQKAEKELTDGQKEIEDGWKEIEKAEKEISDGWKEIEKAEKELSDGWKEIEKAEKELSDGWKEIEKAEKEIVDGQKKLLDAEKELAKAEKELADGERELIDGERELADGEAELIENEAKYWKEKAKADKEIADAEEELADAKLELADLEMTEWYVFSRDFSQVYAEFGQNAERIGALSDVFPLFFFLIAALVCLTTMTRMVEEQRTQIGTLKALGYNKGDIAYKYLMYAALASLFGGIFGALVGQKALPAVVVTAYQMMYVNLPYCMIPYNVWYSVSAIGIVMGCTLFATYFSCAAALKSNAAELMRPEAPKAGKRVLLERIGFIWKRLSFGQKSSVRNLFRYKKRFFMTIVGIGGCMALLLVGFGIRDSIYDIAKFQFEELFTYTGYIVKNDKAEEEDVDALYSFLDNSKSIESYVEVYQTSVDLSNGETEKGAYLICPETTEHFNDFIQFRDRLTKEEFAFEADMDGIILTEKMASMLGVAVGDTITVKMDDTSGTDVTIVALTENYAMHYIYLTPGLYEELFEEVPEYNLLYYIAAEDFAGGRDAFAERLLEFEAASEIQYNDENKKSIDDMLGTLDLVIWVLIICAGLLAFVVLYNLNNINITERRRELATLRVLGFHNTEVAAYVYRESVMLTVIGIVVGMFLGAALHKYVILTVEVDMLMFARKINVPSYIYSALLTMLFSVLINWVMYFKLKKIDMVESLKSIE